MLIYEDIDAVDFLGLYKSDLKKYRKLLIEKCLYTIKE